MSIGRISAGNGYEYLTGAVRNDAHDYYTGAGEAPGRWTGGGTDRLGLAGEVQEPEMALLFGAAAHPYTGEILSTPYRHYRTIEQRIEAKLAELGPHATPEDRLRIRAEQYRIGDRAPVAGYDCTFSAAKSVSALWAIAPAEQRAEIEQAHDQAIDAAFGWLDERALHTRAGRDGVRHLDAEGFLVARFRHRTNRNGDPQLHTHCAVANRVWSTTENRWRALDGQGLYRERAGADAVYMATLEHELTDRLGVTFERRGDVREIATVPANLVERWSTRRSEIVARYGQRADELGRASTPKERSDVLRTVTLQTRQPKTADGHIGLHERWTAEAASTGADWATVSSSTPSTELTVDLDADAVIGAALEHLDGSRAQWSYSHLCSAIAAHAPHALTADDLRDLADLAVSSGRVVDLTVAEIGDSAPLRRRDGESVYRDPQRQLYSTVAVTAAETTLIETADIPDAPTSSRSAVKAGLSRMELGVDQAAAVEQILCGDERITVLIGPAGSGKTHTQRAVVDLARQCGRGVFGLAMSQNASDVLAEAAGCRVENIARTRVNGWDAAFPEHGIVIVDEAAMAGTRDLAWIATQAHDRDCKVVFVGDDRQLQSPSAGGIVRRMTTSHHTVWLSDVRRFSSDWEGAASIALRVGDAGITATYEEHHRLRGGGRDDMLASIVADWWDDQLAGRDTVMITRDNRTAIELSAAARAIRVGAGHVEADGIPLADGTLVGVGDRIVTRENNRRLQTNAGREVINRAVWAVTERNPNGSLTAVNMRWGDRVHLPASYVAAHVELAYASTIAGVQGRTVDGGRTLFDERSSRDELYVAMTRGRHVNVGYGILDAVSDSDTRTTAASAAGLFARCIGNDTREHSAMETFAEELALSESTVRLDGIRDDWRHILIDHLRANQPIIAGDIVRTADHDTVGMVQHVDSERTVAYVRFAEDLDVEELALAELDVVVARHNQLDDLDAAVADDPWAAKLVEYLTAIEEARADRARQLGGDADGQLWTLGVDPALVGDVAYYRDRWQINDTDLPLGPEPGAQRRNQHDAWDSLRQRLERSRTLNVLAGQRRATTDPTVDEAIGAAMNARRDLIVDGINRADHPPEWAQAVLRRSTWAVDTGSARRERDVVGKIAVYRERFEVTAPGLGGMPTEPDQQRIWRGLRAEVASTVQPVPILQNRDVTVDRDHGAER